MDKSLSLSPTQLPQTPQEKVANVRRQKISVSNGTQRKVYAKVSEELDILGISKLRSLQVPHTHTHTLDIS